MQLSPILVQTLDANKVDISGGWLTSSVSVYTIDYAQVLAQPISVEAVTLHEMRWLAGATNITIRAGAGPLDRVLWSGNVNLVAEPVIAIPDNPPASGDMLKSEYDPNDDGIVVAANNVAQMCYFQDTCSAGDPVYFTSGTGGGTVFVAKADASNPSKMPAAGIAINAQPGGTTGPIVCLGLIGNQATGSFTPHQSVYVADAGGISSTPGTYAQIIGTVARSGGGDGVIDINPQPVANAELPKFAGIAVPVPPVFTSTGSGSFTIPTTTVNLYSTTDFTGTISTYSVASSGFTLASNTEQYLCIKYNSGTPVYYLENSNANINGSDVICVYVMWLAPTGTAGALEIHSVNLDSRGLGLANKVADMMTRTQPYTVAFGQALTLNETSSPVFRTVTITGAQVYAGVDAINVLALNSYTNRLTRVNHVAGVWTYTNTTTYDNSNYDNGTNLVSMGTNRYGVRWFYRSIGDDIQAFYTCSGNYSNLADAKAEPIPTGLPILVQDHCVLVGRMIIQQGQNIALSVENVTTTSFQNSSITNHNYLNGLQGNGSDYYHLDATQYTAFGNIPTTYLPRSAGTGNPITGDLYLNPGVMQWFLHPTGGHYNVWMNANTIQGTSGVLKIQGSDGSYLQALGLIADTVGSRSPNYFFKTDGSIDTNTYLTTGGTITLTGNVTGSGPSTNIVTSISSATVTAKVLSGYTVGTNTALTAADTILAAFGKVQGQINATNTALGSYLPLAGGTLTGGVIGTTLALGSGAMSPSTSTPLVLKTTSTNISSYIVTSLASASALYYANSPTASWGTGTSDAGFSGAPAGSWILYDGSAARCWQTVSLFQHNTDVATTGTLKYASGIFRDYAGTNPTLYSMLYSNTLSGGPTGTNYTLGYTKTGTATYLNSTGNVYLNINDGVIGNISSAGLSVTGEITVSSAIKMTGSGVGTYNTAAIFCDGAGIGIGRPRVTDSAGAAIRSFYVGQRGGGTNYFEVADGITYNRQPVYNTSYLTLNNATRQAWGSGRNALTLGGTVSMEQVDSGGDYWIVHNNCYYDGTNNRSISATGYATQFLTDPSGNMSFYALPNNGVNGIITFAAKLFNVDPGGNTTIVGDTSVRTITSNKGASDSIGSGSFIQLADSPSNQTKGAVLQLGASNTLDYWTYSTGTGWTGPKARFFPDGSLSLASSLNSGGLLLITDPWSGSSVYGAIYGNSVGTRTVNNYAIAVHRTGSDSYINGANSSNMAVQGSVIASATGTGATSTLTLSGILSVQDNANRYIKGGRYTAGDPFFYITCDNATGVDCGIRLQANSGGSGRVVLTIGAPGYIYTNGNTYANASITAGNGANIGATIYPWVGTNTYACFSHVNFVATTAAYCLLHSNTGATYINATTGNAINFQNNNGSNLVTIGASSMSSILPWTTTGSITSTRVSTASGGVICGLAAMDTAVGGATDGAWFGVTGGNVSGAVLGMMVGTTSPYTTIGNTNGVYLQGGSGTNCLYAGTTAVQVLVPFYPNKPATVTASTYTLPVVGVGEMLLIIFNVANCTVKASATQGITSRDNAGIVSATTVNNNLPGNYGSGGMASLLLIGMRSNVACVMS